MFSRLFLLETSLGSVIVFFSHDKLIKLISIARVNAPLDVI